MSTKRAHEVCVERGEVVEYGRPLVRQRRERNGRRLGKGVGRRKRRKVRKSLADLQMAE